MRHWTPEQRQRQSELIRNWKPWERSTGPKAPEGKAAVSQNGYKGGIRQELGELSKVLKEQSDFIKNRNGTQ